MWRTGKYKLYILQIKRFVNFLCSRISDKRYKNSGLQSRRADAFDARCMK